MGRIRYTVTTLTTRCPHCGYTLDEETHGALTPIISCLWFITFPILIPYAIIKYLGLGDPDMPKIGQKMITCPHCSLPVRTNNLAIEDLSQKELVTHIRKRMTLSEKRVKKFRVSLCFLQVRSRHSLQHPMMS